MSYLRILNSVVVVVVVVFLCRFLAHDGFTFAFLWILRRKCKEGDEVMHLESMRESANG